MTSSGDRGGHTDLMRSKLSRTFANNAGELGRIIRELNSQATDSQQIWRGPEAERFRTAWQEARASFEKMRQALDEASKGIARAADRIDTATGG